VEQMREAIRNSYLETRKTLAKSQAQKKLLDQLLEKVDFALPESMVEENIDNMVADYKRKLEEQGRSLESTGKSGPEIRDSFREEAERLVKSQVLLLGVAKREGIEVQREEVHEYLRQSAIRNNQDFEAVLRFYEDNNLMFALRDKLAADKAIDLIYANAEIKEVPAESAMIGGEAAERSSEAPKEAEEKTE
jgi:trigger factor